MPTTRKCCLTFILKCVTILKTKFSVFSFFFLIKNANTGNPVIPLTSPATQQNPVDYGTIQVVVVVIGHRTNGLWEWALRL